MKTLKSIIFICFLLVCNVTSINAQNNTVSSGGEATGTGGKVSYTVGQIDYTTYDGGVNGSVAQGVQQPFEISIITGLEEAKGINLVCSAYPNPTTDFLTLKVDASTMLSIQSMSYQLYDISGKLLETKKLESNETSIIMSNLAAATYFLKVTEGNKEVKTFKIIKN